MLDDFLGGIFWKCLVWDDFSGVKIIDSCWIWDKECSESKFFDKLSNRDLLYENILMALKLYMLSLKLYKPNII